MSKSWKCKSGWVVFMKSVHDLFYTSGSIRREKVIRTDGRTDGRTNGRTSDAHLFRDEYKKQGSELYVHAACAWDNSCFAIANWRTDRPTDLVFYKSWVTSLDLGVSVRSFGRLVGPNNSVLTCLVPLMILLMTTSPMNCLCPGILWMRWTVPVITTSANRTCVPISVWRLKTDE